MRFRCPLYVGTGVPPVIEIQLKRPKRVKGGIKCTGNKVYLPCRRCSSDCQRDRRRNRRINLFGPSGILFPNMPE